MTIKFYFNPPRIDSKTEKLVFDERIVSLVTYSVMYGRANECEIKGVMTIEQAIKLKNQLETAIQDVLTLQAFKDDETTLLKMANQLALKNQK